MATHVVPRKVYFSVFIALLILTVLTTEIAYVDLGPWNTVVALIIAVTKASLVAMFFMHLRWSVQFMRLVLVAAVFWLMIMITLTLSDTLTRTWTPVPRSWEASMSLPRNSR